MTIGQALTQTWSESEKNNKGVKTPLLHFLKYQYTERYVKLCRRIKVEPVSFGQWLLRNIDSV